MTERLFEWIISNALASSLLAIVALGVSLFWRRRPALIHACWLLVLIKLLTPPLFTIPIPKPVSLTAPSKDTVPPIDTQQPTKPLEAKKIPTVPPSISVPGQLTESEIAEIFELVDLGLFDAELIPDQAKFGQVPIPPEPSKKQSQPSIVEPAVPTSTVPVTPIPLPSASSPSLLNYAVPLYNWLLSEWMLVFLSVTFAGSGLLLLFVTVRVHRLARLLRYGELPAEPVSSEFTQLCEEFGLKQKPELVLVPGRVGPLLWHAWKKTFIVLPLGLVERVTPAELRTVLAHELTHYRRGDHLWRYLELAALLFYWWLPFAWLASRRLRQAEEECCDAGVVASLPELAGSYASALVRSLSFATEPSSPCPLLTSGLGPVNLLKRRLTMMRERVHRRLGLRGWLLLLAVAGVVLPVGFSWASDDDPPPPPGRNEARQDRPRRNAPERGDRARTERPDPNDDDLPPLPERPGRAATPRLPSAPAVPQGPTPASSPTPMTPPPGMGGFGGAMGMMGGDVGSELRNNAEMGVKQAELEIRVRQVKMKQAESEVKLYQAELQRAEKARQQGGMSESELMIARSKVEMAKTNVELAQIEIERAGLGLQQARHRLETIARRGEPMGRSGMGGTMSAPMGAPPSLMPMQPGQSQPNPPAGGGPPGGFGQGRFGSGGGSGSSGEQAPGAGFGRGEGGGRGFQGGGGFGGGAGLPGVGAARNRARGERGEVTPPAERSDDADPRDRHIQELERQLRDLKNQLEELRKRRPDGPANESNRGDRQVSDERLRTMFDNMDKNKTGKLAKSDLPTFFQNRFEEWDTNHDRFVNFEEFKEGYEKLQARRR